MLFRATLLSLFLLASTVGAQPLFPGGEPSRTLDTTGHAKAKGVKMHIHFPASWAIEEARRPNTVAIAVSEAGRGLENCVVTIHTIEQLGWSKDIVAAETPMSFAAPERLQRGAAENGGRLLAGGPANIEGYPSRWLEVMSEVTRDGRGKTAFLIYQILYNERVVGVLCLVAGKTETEASTKLSKFSATTFRIVMNSIYFPDRWK